MSDDREFDMHAAGVLDISQRNAGRYPGDPDWTDETWERKIRVLATLIYRAGARAGLTHQFGRLDTAIERVRWLVEHDLASADVSELLREVENLRETDRALMSRYGVTDGAIRSMIAEGLHTAFRKASDSPASIVVHKLIEDMPHEEWRAIVSFVADPLTGMLREAEEATEPGEPAWPLNDPELVQAMMRWSMSRGAVITREWFGLPPAQDTAEDQETPA